MREILFRGKRKDNGEWVFGMPWIFKEKSCICPWKTGMCKYDTGFFPVEVVPETVGQFTGLTDKNGKKIFEGDIVRLCKYAFEWEDKSSWEFKIGVIDFEDGCFVINDIYSSDGYNELSCVYNEIHFSNGYDENAIFEVIGNIYDNPEFLGG
jgi:uncharacterized phage protein (TIGR01671 family)